MLEWLNRLRVTLDRLEQEVRWIKRWGVVIVAVEWFLAGLLLGIAVTL